MTQTTGRLFDELAKMMTNAAGMAQGLRAETETVMRAQAERLLHELEVVQREEFEAVSEMASKARAENERLEKRIAALEQALAKSAPAAPKSKPGAAKSGAAKSAAAKKASGKTASAKSTARKPAARKPAARGA